MKKHLQPLTPAALYARVSSAGRTSICPCPPRLRALKDYPKANDYSVARECVAEAETGTVAEAKSLWSGRGQVCCAVSMTVIDLGWGG